MRQYSYGNQLCSFHRRFGDCRFLGYGLSLLKQKTLILMGDDDAIVPLINGKFLDLLIPNGELKVMHGGGHLFLLSHKEESLEAIREFLDAPEDEDEAEAA